MCQTDITVWSEAKVTTWLSADKKEEAAKYISEPAAAATSPGYSMNN